MRARNRIIYAILTIAVMVTGLASRKFSGVVPVMLQPYIGDVLWALMVFFIFGFLFAELPIFSVAVLALIFAFGIEISQLYHAPWIDAIRHTTLGGLVLGFGFLWSDLVCYTIGIGLGVLAERALLRPGMV